MERGRECNLLRYFVAFDSIGYRGHRNALYWMADAYRTPNSSCHLSEISGLLTNHQLHKNSQLPGGARNPCLKLFRHLKIIVKGITKHLRG